jgi:hypothetical protein
LLWATALEYILEKDDNKEKPGPITEAIEGIKGLSRIVRFHSDQPLHDGYLYCPCYIAKKIRVELGLPRNDGEQWCPVCGHHLGGHAFKTESIRCTNTGPGNNICHCILTLSIRDED